MVTAIILVNVERPKLKSVIENVLKVKGVTEVYPVAGEYDLAAIARVKDNKEVSHIVADELPHNIDGITHTKTLIALDCNSSFDIEGFFMK